MYNSLCNLGEVEGYSVFVMCWQITLMLVVFFKFVAENLLGHC